MSEKFEQFAIIYDTSCGPWFNTFDSEEELNKTLNKGTTKSFFTSYRIYKAIEPQKPGDVR